MRIVEALIRAYQAEVYPPFSGPVKLTVAQARLLLSESPVAAPPTDEEWEAMVAAGLPGWTVLGLPTELVATDAESTPWANGWRPDGKPLLNVGGRIPGDAAPMQLPDHHALAFDPRNPMAAIRADLARQRGDVTADVDTHVALADLAGFTVEEWGSDGERMVLTHECGWFENVDEDAAGLPDIVGQALAHARGECLPPRPVEAYVPPAPELAAAMGAALDDLRRTGHADMSPEVLALVEETYGPIGWAKPWLDAALATALATPLVEHRNVPPALAGPAPVFDERVPPGHAWAFPRDGWRLP